MVEQGTENPRVGSSILSLGTTYFQARISPGLFRFKLVSCRTLVSGGNRAEMRRTRRLFGPSARTGRLLRKRGKHGKTMGADAAVSKEFQGRHRGRRGCGSRRNAGNASSEGGAGSLPQADTGQVCGARGQTRGGNTGKRRAVRGPEAEDCGTGGEGTGLRREGAGRRKRRRDGAQGRRL